MIQAIPQKLFPAVHAVMVIANQDFRDEELFDTKEALEDAGVEVAVAAPESTVATGKLGGTIKPDLTLREIKENKFQALIFVGGPGAFSFIDDAPINDLIKEFIAQNKLVAAICIAPAILARAGILHGKMATVHPSGMNFLTENGAILTNNDVEIDGNIITASGPAAASRFGHELANYLIKHNQ